MVTEKILGEYQCRYLPNRSTTYQLFVIRKMMKNYYEHSMDLHKLFVDFRKAFYSVNRERLYEAMKQMEIPDKFIRLTRMTMSIIHGKIKIDNKLSTKFEFSAGVKQGDGLSTVLFIVTLHSVIQTIDQRGTIFTKSSQICAYADDIVIIARSGQKIIEICNEMEENSGKIGLKVNERKTKYMIKSTSESIRKPQDSKVEGKSFMGVSSFRCLGNMINNDNRNDNCVRERTQTGNRAYFANLGKLISRQAKLQVYKTLIRPVATYGGRNMDFNGNRREHIENV
jgi:sorting nexin-29